MPDTHADMTIRNHPNIRWTAYSSCKQNQLHFPMETLSQVESQVESRANQRARFRRWCCYCTMIFACQLSVLSLWTSQNHSAFHISYRCFHKWGYSNSWMKTTWKIHGWLGVARYGTPAIAWASGSNPPRLCRESKRSYWRKQSWLLKQRGFRSHIGDRRTSEVGLDFSFGPLISKCRLS